MVRWLAFEWLVPMAVVVLNGKAYFDGFSEGDGQGPLCLA
jgi:hypothetical protein